MAGAQAGSAAAPQQIPSGPDLPWSVWRVGFWRRVIAAVEEGDVSLWKGDPKFTQGGGGNFGRAAQVKSLQRVESFQGVHVLQWATAEIQSFQPGEPPETIHVL